MDIKILGQGCANCKKLYDATLKAVEELNIGATVSKVEDIKEIARYGVMRTPTLVIDNNVTSVGKILNVEELKKIIQENT